MNGEALSALVMQYLWVAVSKFIIYICCCDQLFHIKSLRTQLLSESVCWFRRVFLKISSFHFSDRR